jgi:hypothetical protein
VDRAAWSVRSEAAGRLAGRADADLGYVVWVEEYNRGLSDPDDEPEDVVQVLINLAGGGVRHLPRVPQPSWVRRPGSPWISLVLEEDRPDRVADIRSLLRGRELIAVYGRPNVLVECRFTFDATGSVQVHRNRVSQ